MFPHFDYSEVALWAVAGYLAVVTLVRFVVYHRGRLIERARDHLAAERRRHATLVDERKRNEPPGGPSGRRHTAA